MTPVVPDDRSHGMQIETGDRCDDIESDLTFEADRLKGKRIVEPPDQAVGAGADADCHAAGNANISTGQCAGSHTRGGRKDGPGQCYVVGEPDLRTEAP